MLARWGEGAGDCAGGRWASRSYPESPLWTLQRLGFEPDVAAASADRGENHDPGAATKENKLTTEMRLENAPVDASFFFGQVPACDQMRSCVRPRYAAFTRRGPVWSCADWDHIAHARSMALRPGAGFPNPVLMTVCPYLSCDLLTSPTSSGQPPPRRRPPDLDRRHREPSRPRRSAPFCLQVRQQPTSSVFVPSSCPTMTPPGHRAAPPSGPQPLHR